MILEGGCGTLLQSRDKGVPLRRKDGNYSRRGKRVSDPRNDNFPEGTEGAGSREGKSKGGGVRY